MFSLKIYSLTLKVSTLFSPITYFWYGRKNILNIITLLSFYVNLWEIKTKNC